MSAALGPLFVEPGFSCRAMWRGWPQSGARMTLTASPNAQAAVDDAAFDGLARATRVPWLTTTDHRRIGRAHLGFVGLFLLAGVATAELVRGELMSSTRVLFNDEPAWFSLSRFYSAHVSLMAALVLAPIWIALGTLAIPTQIGSARLAFPRLQVFVLWGYVLGGAGMIASYLAVDGPPLIHVGSVSNDAAGLGNQATDLALASQMLLTLVAVLAAANFVTTVLTLRRPGLRIDGVRPFTFSMFVTSGVLLLSGPVHMVGLALTYIDTHFKGTLFTANGADRIWVHTMWLFGRPEILLFALPALGVAGDIIVNRIGKPLLGGAAAGYLMVAYAALTLTVWATDQRLTSAALLPGGRFTTALTAIPAGLLVLIWLGSLATAGGGVKPDAMLLAVLGVVVLFGFDLVNFVIAIFAKVQGGSAWIVGSSHVAAFGAPLVAAIGAIALFAPVGWGRHLNQGLTALAVLVFTGGVALSGLANYILGYKDVPAIDVGGAANHQRLHILSGIGGALELIGVLIVIANVALSARRGTAAAGSDEPAFSRAGGAH